ncbi:MAG: hypothetical protein FHP94_05510 [Denitromonas halophila]|nr:MAG: hypothetical protein FHP94_05510 [Denitromonas halophila]
MAKKSNQVKFLEEAASNGVDAALGKHPGTVRADELGLLQALDKKELKQLLALRKASEKDPLAAKDGIGIFSM